MSEGDWKKAGLLFGHLYKETRGMGSLHMTYHDFSIEYTWGKMIGDNCYPVNMCISERTFRHGHMDMEEMAVWIKSVWDSRFSKTIKEEAEL